MILLPLFEGLDPVVDTSVRDLCFSKLLEMGEYLLSFSLLGKFACIMKITYDKPWSLPVPAQRRDDSRLRKALLV